MKFLRSGQVAAFLTVCALAIIIGGLLEGSLSLQTKILLFSICLGSLLHLLLAESIFAPEEPQPGLKELTDQNEALRRQANVDPLTGLLNRWAFQSLLSEERRKDDKNQSVTVFLMDIDHFKSVNDKFGHCFGDTVLQRVAEAVQSSVRPSDHVIRWGGEEFLVVASGLSSRREVEGLSERISLAVSSVSFENNLKVTLSIGAATRSSGENLEALIAKADDCLYEAKDLGRNRLVYRHPTVRR
jgi:diguanylate cyclase (GGDEF)-like protein